MLSPRVTARGYSRFYSVGSAANRSATLDRAASDITNAGALATGRSRRRNTSCFDRSQLMRRSAVETHLKDGEKATPDMTDPNGATVRSQTVPSGYAS